MMDDLVNFKKMLEFFVHIMRANNNANSEEFYPNEIKSGMGYQGKNFQKNYSEWRQFSNGHTMDVTVQAGFPLFNKSSYLHWSDTGANIRVHWNQNKTEIASLQQWDNANNKWIGKEYSVDELGLFDGNEPNDLLSDLFHDYEQLMLIELESRRGGGNMKATELAEKLKQNYNLILRGAPGTGKTYLAKEIVSSIIGVPREELASSDQFEFVQFHPSYDYTDFVEGLRPVQINGQVGFEPKNGTFKEFCKNALLQQNDQFDSFDNVWENFINNVDEAGEVVIPQVRSEREMTYSVNSNRNLKEENVSSVHTLTKENIFRVWQGLKGRESGGHQSRMITVVNYLKDQYNLPDYDMSHGKHTGVNDKYYIFVIDEINRGEISKIFGELFFSIDPEYRGVTGSVSTQYANLFEESEKFYVPENVYIIGTMNDIDRSVDTFDFAMRRRFSFEEITAADSQVMLKSDEVKRRMTALNDAIISPEVSLSTDYQIGASYFRALEDESKNIGVDELWQNKLKPLLKDYFRGERNAEHKLEILESAYFMDDADDSSEG